MSFIFIHYTEMQTYVSITWEPWDSVAAVRLSFVLLIIHLSKAETEQCLFLQHSVEHFKGASQKAYRGCVRCPG